MVAKIFVAILAGTAVAIPSTFWLLKKVRIKSKIRHVQVSLALGLPVALFVFLLQTSFALPIVIITVAFSLLVVTLELTLRRIVSHVPSPEERTLLNKNGTAVPFDVARTATGSYPDDYMTKDFWLVMNEFVQSRSRQKDDYRKLKIGSERNSYVMHRSINFDCPNYSVVNGLRTTTGSPSATSSKHDVNIFGGSTVFCEEVPDRLTISSILQQLLNVHKNSVNVFNLGASGATSIDRVQMLLQDIKVKKDDVVVFYFGDNDSGWIDHRTGKPSEQLVWLPVRTLKALSNFGFETARWMYGESAPRSFHKYSRLAVADTITALNEAHEYCRRKGAHMIAVLQPNLYTLQTKSEYEKKLEKRFSQDIKTLVIDAYKQYEAWVKEIQFGVSATHIFNNAEAPVFLDWAHVNARGNEFIAKFIFEELKKRKLISVDEEV